MTNPYAAPESVPELMVGNQHSLRWVDCRLSHVLMFSVIAAVVSATCVSVFYIWCELSYGGYGAGSPPWMQVLCAASIYSAGVILAIGFGLMSGQRKEQPKKLLWLAIGGFACLLLSELSVIVTANFVPWVIRDIGILANIALRSATLSLFVCWMLDVRVRKRRLLILVLVGTPGWGILFMVIGMVDSGLPEWTYSSRSAFNTAWTFVAAWQLWAILLPPKAKVQERHLKREDFLPATFSLDHDAPQLDIEV